MNSLYEKGREGFLAGSVDWDADDIRAIMINRDLYADAITAATNATPIVITIASHGYSNGDLITIAGVGGNTAANGLFRAASVTANTFALTDATTGANIAGNGAYTSGGFCVNLTQDDFLDDVPAGARVAVSGALTGKTTSNGVADADDVEFTAVTGATVEAIIIYKHTGSDATARLILYVDSGTGLNITPNGGNVLYRWDNGSNRIFRL